MNRGIVVAAAALGFLVMQSAFAQNTQAARALLGFDRNGYPGDSALPALRQSFSYSSYWLNNPPEARQNTWTGKRTLLRQQGFGFLVLFNGRLFAELKGKDAAKVGTTDGKDAVAAAQREGFPQDVLIFLDMEEGGRMLPQQDAYLFAWADAVRNGGARAGVYCSGIDVPEGSAKINTAQDIVERENARAKSSSEARSTARLKLWIANDQCPPSPGCVMTAPNLAKAVSPEIARSVVVWQYVQSPRRPEFSSGCPANVGRDENCYAPGLAHGGNSFLDLDTAESADPSGGR